MINGKQEITWADMEACPVWRFDPDRELFLPLINLDDQIGSINEVHFRAIFMTPDGKELSGSIAGDGSTAIGIFRNGRWYAANKKWKQTSFEQLSLLIKDSPDLRLRDARDLFPLRFETKIEREPFVDRKGVFDLT
jgi:hypothetical protein